MDQSGAAEMVLFCKRNGQLGIARSVPTGAIEFARGGGALLKCVLIMARDAAQPRGTDQLPGMTAGLDHIAAHEVMRSQMRRLERLVGDGVTFNTQLDMRFIG